MYRSRWLCTAAAMQCARPVQLCRRRHSATNPAAFYACARSKHPSACINTPQSEIFSWGNLKHAARSTKPRAKREEGGSATITTVGRDSEDSSEIQVLQVEWETDFGRPQFRTFRCGTILGFAAQTSSIGAHTPSRRETLRQAGSDGMQWQASCRKACFPTLPSLVCGFHDTAMETFVPSIFVLQSVEVHGVPVVYPWYE